LEDTDSIVNAANASLAHGAGVAGAVVNRGGISIQNESSTLIEKRGSSLDTGDAVITRGGKLFSPWVIHAVGPIFEDGTANEAELLMTAVKNSLLLASEKGLYSIALPAISSGIFGFPKDRCASIMFDTVLDFFGEYPTSSLKLVRLTNLDRPTARIFTEEYDKRFKPVDPKNFDDILDEVEVDLDALRDKYREDSEEEELKVKRPTRFGENGEEDSSSSADSLEGGFYVRKAAFDGDYPDEDIEDDVESGGQSDDDQEIF
jgi:putative ATPase